MRSSSDKVEAGKIFVWGQAGQILKDLDEKRMLAIAQHNPNYYLSLMANSEIKDIIKAIMDKDFDLPDNIKKDIINLNEKDCIFREVAKFLREAEDMLSTGSFLTGEMDEKTALMRLRYGGDDDE